MTRPRYYDRQGRPIDLLTWSALSGDWDYKQIRRDAGAGRVVSTIWLGLDHSFDPSPDAPPIIFETMVFGADKDGEIDVARELDCERYSTEEEALKGHEEMAAGHVYILDKIVRKLSEEEKKGREKLKLWTIQTDGAYERLMGKGVLYGDWRRVERSVFKPAYKWLCAEMEGRGIQLKGRPPLWAWEKRPDLRRAGHLGSGERGYLLEIEVPREQVLFSHFEAWHCVLNNHYLVTEDSELEGMFDHPQNEVEASWQKIFDREVMGRIPGYGDIYQATFPILTPDQVLSEKAFSGR